MIKSKSSRNRFLFRDPLFAEHPFYSTEDGTGGGGGAQSETDKNKQADDAKASGAQTETVNKTDDTSKSSALLTRDELFEENTRLKTRVADLNRENTDKRHTAKFGDDQAAELAKYRELGKVDDLKTALDTGKTAQGKVAESERLNALESAAKSLGFKSALLKRLAPALPVISKEIDIKGDDGKFTKEQQWFFKDGDKETEISKFFEGDDETLALLKADEEAETGKRNQTQNTVQTGKKFVQQGGGDGKAKPRDVTGDYLKNRYGRPKTKQE